MYYMAKNGITIRVAKNEVASHMVRGFRFSTKERFAASLDRLWNQNIFLVPTRRHMQDAIH
jgi:hypothetical protein